MQWFFLHTGGDTYALGPPIFNITISPKIPISPKGPCFRGWFWGRGNYSQRPLHFSEMENISHSLKLKTPFLETLPPIFGHICMLTPSAYTPILPFPSLRILGV